jgi:dihydroorotate dehydrogenase
MTPAIASALVPLLRRMDPETAHGLALHALRRGLAGRSPKGDDPALAVTALGLSFANPIGLAAGFDKDGIAVRPLSRLGFGFVEIGTLTPQPQEGNERPRIFRLDEDQAVINRLGFNNHGLDACLARLARGHGRHPASPCSVPLGINLGINKTRADPVLDYPALVQAASRFADYVVINVSSPNTPGLRDLQAENRLKDILGAIAALEGPLPALLVKLAPDLADEDLEPVVTTCIEGGVRGLIVSNTTIARPRELRSRFASEVGGLSGPPLFTRSTAMLARAYLLARQRLTLVGVGGVRSGRDALSKLQAGATLVQLYTAFAYEGPALIPKIKAELLYELHQAGFANVSNAIGTQADKWAACPL